MGSDNTRLMVAQQSEADVAPPSGVAFRLGVHQRLFLQVHYVNTTPAPQTILATVDLKLAPAGAALVPANSLFDGNRTFSIKPNGATTVTYFIKPAAPLFATRHVFAVTSHTHKYGVKATIEHVANAYAPATTPLHVSTSWEEPPLTMLSPPADFWTFGSDGLRLTCSYVNTSAVTVSYGTATTDEMCFMWIYYYDR